MANLKDIKTRIVSVKSTQKITSAMKMVSNSKLRKAQKKLLEIRPYSNQIRSVIDGILDKIEEKEEGIFFNPTTESDDILFIVISGDRGLCGAFNSNITKATKKFLEEEKENYSKCDLVFIGKKSYDSLRDQKEYSIKKFYKDFMDDINVKSTRILFNDIISSYKKGEYKKVYLIYNEFKSIVSQTVILEKLLPIDKKENENKKNVIPYIFEPSKKKLLEEITDQYLLTELYRALLESYVSEQGARMNAMESASNNADDMIKSLTLKYNRARQAAITTELVEVISGAQALE